MKSPRLYFSDVGVRNELAGGSEPDGAVYENFVASEVRKLLVNRHPAVRLSFYRAHGGHEVDFLLETQHGVIAIEVKSRPDLRTSDATALRALRRDLGERFRVGLVVHPGRRIEELSPDVFAVPDATLVH